MVGLKVSGGIRETEEMEEFVGSIQCHIQTEELPPQHAEVIYYEQQVRRIIWKEQEGNRGNYRGQGE